MDLVLFVDRTIFHFGAPPYWSSLCMGFLFDLFLLTSSMLWTCGLEILREMLHLRLGREHTGFGKSHKEFQNSKLFTVATAACSIRISFKQSISFVAWSAPHFNSFDLGNWTDVCNFRICAILFFCICVFHRLLHFLCTEDLSIRQAPHYPQACNLPQCLRRGGSGVGLVRGHLYGTPIARPYLVTNPPPDRQNRQLQVGFHLISCRPIYHLHHIFT